MNQQGATKCSSIACAYLDSTSSAFEAWVRFFMDDSIIEWDDCA